MASSSSPSTSPAASSRNSSTSPTPSSTSPPSPACARAGEAASRPTCATTSLATQRLLEAAKRHPAQAFRLRLVLVGLRQRRDACPRRRTATPRPFSPYGVTKLAAEHLCDLYHANYGVDTVALRYFTVYGPRQRPDMAFNRFCRAAIAGTPIDRLRRRAPDTRLHLRRRRRRAPPAPLRRPPCRRPGRTTSAAARRSASREALELIEGYAGRPLAIEHLAGERGDVRDTGADTSRARAELGFEPTVPLEDGLREEYEWALGTTRAREVSAPVSRTSPRSPARCSIASGRPA